MRFPTQCLEVFTVSVNSQHHFQQAVLHVISPTVHNMHGINSPREQSSLIFTYSLLIYLKISLLFIPTHMAGATVNQPVGVSHMHFCLTGY